MASSRGQRVIVVGGVAGGMSAATRLRRLDESAEITVIERSGHVSYANCGLPYYVGGVIEDEEDLLLQTPERLWERFRLDVRVGTEVVGIDAAGRSVTVRTAGGGPEVELPYDALILSPGALPILPPLPGIERARVLRTVEDASLLAGEAGSQPSSAVVVGGGFVGLETAENLCHRGIPTTLVEAAGQLLSPLDPELAIILQAELEHHGVEVITGAGLAAVDEASVLLTDGREIPAELVVAAIGVRPDVRLGEMAGIEIGARGGIVVDHEGRTSDPAIFAVGDAVEKTDAVDGSASLIALANIANRQGRRVADAICGLTVPDSPSLGTAIVKVFDKVAGMTGWNAKRLEAAGRPFVRLRSHPMSHAGYYPGAEPMSLVLLVDPVTKLILGAEGVGSDGVDKRIDVLATAMAARLEAPALAELELAYAPPFSSAKDPVNMLGYMAENLLSGDSELFEADETADLVSSGWELIDVRTTAEFELGAIPGARSIPLDELRERVGELHGPALVYCQVGQRGHTAATLLHELGLRARNMNGGYRSYLAATAARHRSGELLRPAS